MAIEIFRNWKRVRNLSILIWNSTFIAKHQRRRERRIRRYKIAMSYFDEKFDYIKQWAKLETEDSNFYYELDQLNELHLANMISFVTGESIDVVEAYFAELKNDLNLRHHFEFSKSLLNGGKDTQVLFGRRLGWYALVRIVKPGFVIETGVDHGVGACVITSALIRNQSEGFPGEYMGTDIRKSAGEVFTGPYSDFGRIVYGDSIQSLKKVDRTIDIFINDSDHSAKYEFDEYQIILPLLSDRSFILGDNSHVTESLPRFSRENNRRFIFYAEKPKNHWYPGAGIGFSF